MNTENLMNFFFLIRNLDDDQFSQLIDMVNTTFGQAEPEPLQTFDETLTGDGIRDMAFIQHEIVPTSHDIPDDTDNSSQTTNDPVFRSLLWESIIRNEEDEKPYKFHIQTRDSEDWKEIDEFVFYRTDPDIKNITIDVNGTTAGIVADQLEDGFADRNIAIESVDHNNEFNNINILFSTESQLTNDVI